MSASMPGGPCGHCGRTHTPCWRKGPPEKAVLCNACGSRWLVKRSLDGYFPAAAGSKPLASGNRIVVKSKKPSGVHKKKPKTMQLSKGHYTGAFADFPRHKLAASRWVRFGAGGNCLTGAVGDSQPATTRRAREHGQLTPPAPQRKACIGLIPTCT